MRFCLSLSLLYYTFSKLSTIDGFFYCVFSRRRGFGYIFKCE
nr:MAG TPA: Glucose-induced degradation protein-like protein [Caudoviricetes sp.]